MADASWLYDEDGRARLTNDELARKLEAAAVKFGRPHLATQADRIRRGIGTR